MNWILCITFIWYHVILQQAHIVVSDQMPIPQPSVPRQANKPFPHKMWVLSFLPTLGHSTRGGDYGEIVSTCLSLLPNVKSFSQFLCFFFFFPFQESIVLYIAVNLACFWEVSILLHHHLQPELVYISMHILMQSFLCVFLFGFSMC